jgi:nicotinamidase-related amidase
MRKAHIPTGLTRNKACTVVKNCRLALSLARHVGWPVIHVRNSATNDKTINRSITGFEPEATEAVLEREKCSCYSSPYFADLIRQTSGNIVIMGFFGSGGVLATVADAVQTSDYVTLLWDASLDEQSAPIFSGPVLSLFQRYTTLRFSVRTTAEWLDLVRDYYDTNIHRLKPPEP